MDRATAGKNGFIEITIPIYDAQSKEVEGVMIVSTPTRDIRKNRDDLNRKVLILQIGMGVCHFSDCILSFQDAGKAV